MPMTRQLSGSPCSFPLAGKSEHTAVRAFVAPIQRAISCFFKEQVRPTGYKSDQGIAELVFNNGEPAQFQGNSGLALELAQQYEIVHAGDRHLGPYKVSTRAYQYSLVNADDDSEVYAYHWHPDSHHTIPHVHAPPNSKTHLPTGRIAIEQMLLLAYELGAQPIDPQWRRKIVGALDAFEEHRTWHYRPP